MELKLAVLFLAGLGAGFFNIMAGGGSLATIPALIMLGLPPTVANGTNRIALLFQNIAALKNFKNKGYIYPKPGFILAIPAVIGALIGSSIAARIDENLFKQILGGVMLLSLLAIIFKKKNSSHPKSRDLEIKNYGLLMVAFLGVGLYGGMIQAGVGFIIIFTLSFIPDINLIQINSIKIFVVLIYTIFAILVFVIHSKINLTYGLILALGNSIGGWLGVHYAVKKGEKLIRLVFFIAIFAMALKMLELF